MNTAHNQCAVFRFSDLHGLWWGKKGEFAGCSRRIQRNYYLKEGYVKDVYCSTDMYMPQSRSSGKKAGSREKVIGTYVSCCASSRMTECPKDSAVSLEPRDTFAFNNLGRDHLGLGPSQYHKSLASSQGLSPS